MLDKIELFIHCNEIFSKIKDRGRGIVKMNNKEGSKMDQFTILIADDEEEMLDLISFYLKKEGYEVITALNGNEVLQKLDEQKIDLILLDILMPNLDGFTTCKKIREVSKIPIIMLTAKSDERDRIHGIKIGADDYIVKPFSPKELIVRVEAMLRRTYNFQTDKSNSLSFKNLIVNKPARKVTIENQEIDLTRKEFDLLLFFLEHKNHVFSREQLLDKIWGMDYQKSSARTVDTHIKTLRYKLNRYGSHIKTIYGVGYSFEDS